MAIATTGEQPTYALGHASSEIERLGNQARYFGDLTAQMLQSAGIGPGMRVLDVGCAAGDVTFLAAGMVGPGGAVIGVDRAPEAIRLASERAASAGVKNVTFQVQDLADLALDAPVDAVIGRFVLMYLSDPAVVLRRLAGLVKAGGIVAFHEFDLEGAKSEPPCMTFETAMRRVRQTLRQAGADCSTGLKLGRIYQEAGLPMPQMALHARVEFAGTGGGSQQVAGITRTLLPLMERTQVATADDVGIDTLAQRIDEEAAALKATLVSPSLIGAWVKKPERN